MKKIFILGLATVALLFVFSACMPQQADVTAETNVQQEQLTNNTTHEVSLDYGAKGAMESTDYTIEEMLSYAIQDEYLARQEYESIIEEFGDVRPYTNIIKAEETHIAMLKDVYNDYGFSIPEDNAIEYVMIPENLDDTYAIGVQAEIDNIAMYEKFLEQEDLPDDIREVFVELRDASENHLAAFEKGPRGNGRNW